MSNKKTTDLYRHFNSDGILLYAGISRSALERIGSHKSNSHWYESITRVEVEKFNTRMAASKAERLAIINEKPLHNVMFSTINEKKQNIKKQEPKALNKKTIEAQNHIIEFFRKCNDIIIDNIINSNKVSNEVSNDAPDNFKNEWWSIPEIVDEWQDTLRDDKWEFMADMMHYSSMSYGIPEDVKDEQIFLRDICIARQLALIGD